MLKVALTGGICSGKSFLADILKNELNIDILSADECARHVSSKGQEGYNKIINEFGVGILLEDGSINRVSLAKEVFSNHRRLLDLEKIIHPLVRACLEEKINNIEKSCVVVEIPLLFEANFQDLVDKIIVIACTEDKQIERCQIRDGLTEEEVRQRMIRQMPLREKVMRADFIIDNNLSKEETRRQIENLWPKIIKSE